MALQATGNRKTVVVFAYRHVSSLCELWRRKFRHRIISSVVLWRRNPRDIKISSVVDCLRIAGRGAHSVMGNGGGARAHGLGSLWMERKKKQRNHEYKMKSHKFSTKEWCALIRKTFTLSNNLQTKVFFFIGQKENWRNLPWWAAAAWFGWTWIACSRWWLSSHFRSSSWTAISFAVMASIGWQMLTWIASTSRCTIRT